MSYNIPANLAKYRASYNYRDLVSKHRLSEEGLWRVNGEDPNCDMGGSHVQPYLGTFEGKLEDIVTHAVSLPGFWQWGAGGTISKVAPVKINAEINARRNALESKIKDLEAQITRARKELENL